MALAMSISTCVMANAQQARLFPPQTVGQSIGVNVNRDMTRAEFDAMVSAGITYVRKDLFWHAIERERGQYTWGPYDEFDAMLRDRGLKPVYILCYGNGLYNDDTGATMDSPEAREAFARWAAASVARYDRPGVIWEIWNEQNGFKFWKASNIDAPQDEQARENATSYMKLLTETVAAMREVNPDVVIISGGVINPGWDLTQEWLDRAMDLGMLDMVDGVGVHFYNRNRNHEPDTYVLEYTKEVRDLMRKHGADPATKPILHTEWGPSIEKHILTGTHEERLMMQANLVVRMHLLTQAAGIPLNVIYQWVQNGGGSYQIYDAESPRPVLPALRTLSQQLGPYRFRRRVDVADPDVFVLEFGREDQTKLAVWTVGDPQPVTLPVAAPVKELGVVQMLGEVSTLELSGGHVTVTATASPQYISVPESDNR